MFTSSPHAISHIISVEIASIAPTQMTIGKIEVEKKREEWSNLSRKNLKRLLESHYFPGVIGPGGIPYIVDRHHLGLALIEEEIKFAGFAVLKDMSEVEPELFWNVMEYFRWAHPFDENGQRCDFRRLPKTLTGMTDDPYRSLAGALREVGGYAKDTSSYSEFLWADFLRNKIPIDLLNIDFKYALSKAKVFALSAKASYLPGWTGRENVAIV